jgi:transposase-like protein
MAMTKQQAAAIFESKAGLARALGISRQAINQWPDQLEERQINEVIGAAVRLGKPVPEGFIAAPDPAIAT